MRVSAGLTGIKLTEWHSCLWHEICTVNKTLLCLCDGESFTTGLLNISWNSKILVQTIAEWAGICFSICVGVPLHPTYQLYTVCVYALGISQCSYNCSCYLSRGANKDNAVSGLQMCREGFANILWIVICLKCFLSPPLTHSKLWRSHKPNLIFWTLAFLSTIPLML